MTGPVDLSRLFALVREGNVAARNALLTATRDDLARRAAGHLRRFRVVTHEWDADDVLGELVERLIRAMNAGRLPTTLDEFFGMAVVRLKRLLIDKADKLRRRDELAPTVSLDGDAADSAGRRRVIDPAAAAEANEFRRRVGELPADERRVVEMHLLEDRRQAEVAAALGWPPRQVSRKWQAATARLTGPAWRA